MRNKLVKNKNILYLLYCQLGNERAITREVGTFKLIFDNYPKYVLSLDKADFSKDGIIHKNIIDGYQKKVYKDKTRH